MDDFVKGEIEKSELIHLHLPTEFRSSRQPAKHKKLKVVPAVIYEIVEFDFSKKFSFKKNPGTFNLLNLETMFQEEDWEVPSLKRLKTELNEIKGRLNQYELKDWHNHTRYTNHAGNVIPLLKKKIRPELLTQAWCKFFEIACSFPLIPLECEAQGIFNTFHLCEAPGAFVTSLNHFLHLNNPELKWNWLATSLNPYYEGNSLSEMIGDDRFVMNTLSNWCFGKDCSGDLLKEENFNDLISKAKKIGPISLVTADGSVDCQHNPGEQELIISRLQYSEALTALHILAPGGNLVAKFFTIFECSTVCLLYLLYSVFEFVHCFKPITSREGNSEIYLIFKNYIGKEKLPKIFEIIKNNTFETICQKRVMFSKFQIPEYFIKEVEECSAFFTNIQIDVLKRNIYLYEHEITDEIEKLAIIKETIAESFIERFKLSVISGTDKFIIGNQYLHSTPILNLEKRNEDGSFQGKLECLKHDEKNQLLYLRKVLESIEIQFDLEETICWLHFDDLEIPPIYNLLLVICGAPYKKINSSKFCFGKLIHIRNLVERYVRTCDSTYYETNFNKIHYLFPALKDEDTKKCNVALYSWYSDFSTIQNIAFKDIFESIQSLKLQQNLIIIGLPLLSQFNVALVFLLGFMFDYVGLLNPLHFEYGILCQGLKTIEHFKIFSKINEHLSLGQSIISIFPITYLCGQDDFYRIVSSTNNYYQKLFASKVIDNALLG